MALMRQVGEVRIVFRGPQDHAAAVSAVAAVGSAAGRVLFPAEAEAAVAPSPSLHEDRDPVDEHGKLTKTGRSASSWPQPASPVVPAEAH